MGHLVNPIGFRLGIIRFWTAECCSYSNKYVNFLFFFNLAIEKYLLLKYCQKKFITSRQIFLTSIKLIYHIKSVYCVFYFYNMFFESTRPFQKQFFLLRKLKKNKKFISLLNQLIILINKSSFIRAGIVDLVFISYYVISLIIFPIKLCRSSKVSSDVSYEDAMINFTKYCRIVKTHLFLLNKRCYFPVLKFLLIKKNDYNVNARLVALYIKMRFQQRYQMKSILRPAFKWIRELNTIKGFKVACSGRISRKQRATYYWKSGGSLGYGNPKVMLDYAFESVPLRFGTCGIKVWLRYR